ncbi:MAG: MaoC family dehydratase [Candidatus Hodarchaeales archaeon]
MQKGKSIHEINIGDFAEDTMEITEEHIELYAKMSGDRNPLHFDKEYCKQTIFQRPIAHGPIAGSLVAKIIGMQFPGLGTLAYNIKMNFLVPVYPGDVIKAVVIATEKIVDKNLLRLSFEVTNQDGLTVIDGYANVMPPIG